MEYCCTCKYLRDSLEASYSDDSQADHRECSPCVDNSQYFDIDISSPISPTNDIETSSSISQKDIRENEFEFDFSISNANPRNPNLCVSPGENLFYRGKPFPLQPIFTSRDDDDVSENEIEFDFSASNAIPPNPNLCISPAENLFYQGKLLPLHPIFTFREYENIREDEFEFEFPISNANPPNPIVCISPADNLFYRGKLLPLQPILTSREYEEISDDEFEFNFSISNTNLSNSNLPISSAEDLFYQGQVLPLKPVLTSREYDVGIKDVAPMQSSSNVPAGIKNLFPKLVKTATKLKISFHGFQKLGKLGMNLKFPSGTGLGMDSFEPKNNRLFTGKLKFAEVPMEHNYKGAKRADDIVFQKKSEYSDDGRGKTCKHMSRKKKRAKEIVKKYVKIEHLFVKMSQKGNDKSRCDDLEKLGDRNGTKNRSCQRSDRSEKQISFSYFSGNLNMVYKHLGNWKQSPSDIRWKHPNYSSSDSTLMDVQNAVQGAIAHCKLSNYIH